MSSVNVAAREMDTQRLILRPLALQDAAAVQRVFPRWEIVRLLAAHVPWPFPTDGVLAYYRDRALPAIARGEEWHWTLRLRTAPEEIIGAVGVMLGEDDNRGFWIAPEWQRQGLMTEAADRVTAFWFEDLGMGRMRVPKAAENVGSRRVSEKQGMRVVKREEREYVSGRLATEIWEITRAEWLRRSSGHGR